MITKHFYRLDEVKVALMYAIKKNRVLEAAFWCEELICSGYWIQAWATLLQSWLWFCLVTNPAWIQNRIFFTESDIDSEEGKGILHQACYNLCQAKKDNSLWAILATVGSDMPDRVCGKKPDGLTYESELDAYLCAAICQGKAACAWWAVKALDYKTGRIPDIFLESLMESVGLVGEAWNQVTRCATVLIASTPDNEYDTGMSPVLMTEIRRWRAIHLNRKARVYGIPDECLYGLTERGRMERTGGTMKELYNIHVLLYDGEDIEEFFNTVFPDDIPDEWSLADQRKSHGSGSLRKGETITLKKFGTIWMTDPCIYAWGFHESPYNEATGLEDIGLVHMKSEDLPMESLLKSVHKQLVIE
jgi:hypothetical protein